MQLEASLTKTFQEFTFHHADSVSPFPVIIGRRSHSASSFSKKDLHDDLPPFLAPLVANCIIPTSNTIIEPSFPLGNSQNRSVFVPDIGWASQPSSDELQVQFNDGARLSLKYSTATVQNISYTPPPAEQQSAPTVTQSYSPSTPLPAEVRLRLEAVPVVVKFLRSTAAGLHPP